MKISAYVKQPGRKPYHSYVSDSLENLQRMVGGYIECVTLPSGMVIICNEEGKLHGLPYNCKIAGETFVGDILFVGTKDEEFADVPIGWDDFKAQFPQLFHEDAADGEHDTVTVKSLLEEMADKMCDEYCKWPEIYGACQSYDQFDEMNDRVCSHCPLNKLGV